MQYRRLISPLEVSKLTGLTRPQVSYRLKNGWMPEPEQIERFKFYDAESILKWMEQVGIEPECDVKSIGCLFPVVKGGDRLLLKEEVLDLLDLSRSWFEEAVSRGIFPPPDVAMGPPYPSFWLESTLHKWIQDPGPDFKFTRLPDRSGVQVHVGDQVIGRIFKVLRRTRHIRINNKPAQKPIWGWEPDGCDQVFDHRKDAAIWLYERGQLASA